MNDDTTMRRRRIFALFCVVFLLFSGSIWACGDEDDDTTSDFVPTDQSQTDDEDDDGDDEDDDKVDDLCVDVNCSEGEVCTEGVCFEETDEGYSCAEPFDFGLLSDGDRVEKTVDPRGMPNLHDTECSEDDESPQAVFRVASDVPMEFELDAAHTSDEVIHPLIREIRTDSCVDSSARMECTASATDWVAEPGVDYYIVVEAYRGQGIGEFELEIEATEVVCAPAGESVCEDDDLLYCMGGYEEQTLSCLGGCEDRECLGDHCANAIPVDGSITVEGETQGFGDTVDIESDPACGLEDDEMLLTGEDVVFEVSDLMVGDVVEATAPDSDWAIVVVDDCAETDQQCVTGDGESGELVWDVEEDGDYYVVMNRLAAIGGGESDGTSGGWDGSFSIDVSQ